MSLAYAERKSLTIPLAMVKALTPSMTLKALAHSDWQALSRPRFRRRLQAEMPLNYPSYPHPKDWLGWNSHPLTR